ncbi:rubredoxin family protein [Cucumis melo var. makuwa]|uniref:Uncharacterized protein LOC103502280 isoform X1 n=4 Tax=Cucumis melo TaxID=3656 RepID=A0A1S3CLS9_CUCME|nr:uncharacterized protein LOC103502280 isoform X1 [Cucumis melo]XP_050937449.1 uncharacterized protein LOC103502280 isoform X2 [Cucumis melo]XP_050937450.1 uncharacterized protein LOC103502280 isoform X3 [Cucumis melo]ADN33860.1 electron transporter [Cucumis melo subsp. melo]KAA0057733.1 rubredoxin family protein [Cucumis melo var. makuwa]TYJ98419.1 rubredoxin family protein [Cucumis melo var. makuwa]
MASVSASSLSFHLPPKPHYKLNQEDGGTDRNSMFLDSASNRLSLKSSFISPLRKIPSLRRQNSVVAAASPKFSMRVASKQAYICRDCGYIYNDRTPFDKLPDKYFCPVCGAPKRRFRPYEQTVNKNDNEFDLRKARKAQIQKDEAIGKVLPIAAALGIVALVGLYLYLNSVF